MEINTPFTDSKRSTVPKSFDHLLEANREDLSTVIRLLTKITNLSPEVVQPHLDSMLEQLVKSEEERPFYETATNEEWIHALQEWSASHDRSTPLLSDYAVSREGIYDDEEI